MNLLAQLFLIVLTLIYPLHSALADEATSAETNDVSLTLSAPEEMTTEQNWVIRGTLTNSTDHPIYFGVGDDGVDYPLKVTDEQGKVVRPRARPASMRVRLGSLAAHESYSFGLSLNNFYNVTDGGVFLIRASRKYLKELSTDSQAKVTFFKATSNLLRIEIKPPPPTQLVLVSDQPVTVNKQDVLPPVERWKVGDNWKLFVEVFRKTKPLTPAERELLLTQETVIQPELPRIERYFIDVRVQKIEQVGESQQATLGFYGLGEAPVSTQNLAVQVVLNRLNGQLIRVTQLGESTQPEVRLDTFGDRPVSTVTTAGFPIDVVPPISGEWLSADSSKRLRSSRSDFEERQQLEASLSVNGQDKFRVTQLWNYGALWWSRFIREEFDSGLVLRATRIEKTDVYWGAPQNGLKLGIVAPEIHQNDVPVRLKIALCNFSDHDVEFEPPLRPTHFILSGHQSTRLTDAGTQGESTSRLTFDIKTLPAHSTIYGEILLGMYYNGAYALKVAVQHPSPALNGLKTPLVQLSH